MSKLTGKVAIVTGASKGIGAGIAKSLAADGASVVVNYASSKTGAEKVVAAITAAGGKAVAVKGDVSKAADANGIIDAAIKNFGRIDILVNNSGVYEFGSIESVTEDSVPQDVQHQCARSSAHHAGSGEIPERRRQHYQYRLRRQLALRPPTPRFIPAPKARWTQLPACLRVNLARERSG